jgi:hypothetical protein
MSVLGMFYRWAMAEQYASAVPFTYTAGGDALRRERP